MPHGDGRAKRSLPFVPGLSVVNAPTAGSSCRLSVHITCMSSSRRSRLAKAITYEIGEISMKKAKMTCFVDYCYCIAIN